MTVLTRGATLNLHLEHTLCMFLWLVTSENAALPFLLSFSANWSKVFPVWIKARRAFTHGADRSAPSAISCLKPTQISSKSTHCKQSLLNLILKGNCWVSSWRLAHLVKIVAFLWSHANYGNRFRLTKWMSTKWIWLFSGGWPPFLF